MIPCSNEKCKQHLLPWSQESHLAVCKHTEGECFLCDSPISLDSLIEHIKTECDTEWLEKDNETTAGSALMVTHQFHSANRFAIKLPDTKANVSIISQQMVLMMKWDDNVGYYVSLIDSAQNHSRMEIYYTLKPNSHCITYSRVSMLGANTIAEVESLDKLAHLPLDVQEISFTANNVGEYEVTEEVGRVISNLLVQ
jgi:hypothetical protein